MSGMGSLLMSFIPIFEGMGKSTESCGHSCAACGNDASAVGCKACASSCEPVAGCGGDPGRIAESIEDDAREGAENLKVGAEENRKKAAKERVSALGHFGLGTLLLTQTTFCILGGIRSFIDLGRGNDRRLGAWLIIIGIILFLLITIVDQQREYLSMAIPWGIAVALAFYAKPMEIQTVPPIVNDDPPELPPIIPD